MTGYAKNKFEQYAEVFEANDIDLDILPELTEDDLGKLGVSGTVAADVTETRRRIGAVAPLAQSKA